jgi:hypothetical protein
VLVDAFDVVLVVDKVDVVALLGAGRSRLGVYDRPLCTTWLFCLLL